MWYNLRAEATFSNPVGLERLLKLDFAQLNDRGQKLLEVIKRATYPEIFQATAAQRQILTFRYSRK
jgi:hypothetical protein